MVKKGRIRVIFNPVAGKGKAVKHYPGIERFLHGRALDFEIFLTKAPGHAQEIVRNLPLEPDDITVAVGGDGTCNEVVNGLLTHSPALPTPPLFGVLPAGRGNDFSSTPGIPKEFEKALEFLVAEKVRPLDVGLVKGGFFPEGRYFVNGVGIGFDTRVGFEAEKLKIKSGITYALGWLITIARYEPSPVVRIRYDDNKMTLQALIISIVNGRRMGGRFYVGPNAVLDDGLLDICFSRHQPSRLKLLKIGYHYAKATQSQCSGIYTGRGSFFHLEALEGGMAAHCDGETVCYQGKELEISCIPGALRLVGGLS